MAIGSRVPGRDVIAGQYGFLEQARTMIEFSQEVQEVEPARTLIEFEQDVREIEPARTLINFQQQVLAPGQTPATTTPPPAYVTINDQNVTGMTARDTVQITFNEGQSATASIFLFVEVGAAINIPSFHGKRIRIETHADPSDVESEIIPLFTGWIETARHDRRRMGIDIQATDLRSERLGRENRQSLQALTGGLYSTATQQEDVADKDYITELMKTVSGSIGYNRSGSLSYHSWGVDGKTVDLVLGDADVSYENLTTEFQTRSSVINSIELNFSYRYHALREFYTSVDLNMTRPQKLELGGAFSTDSQVSKATGYSPWKTLLYGIYPAVKLYINYFLGTTSSVPVAVPGRSDGHIANLVRQVAQPVVEQFKVKVQSPQSIDAYGEEVQGSNLNYSYDADYSEDLWEESFSFIDNATDSIAARSVRQNTAAARNDQFHWWEPSAFYASDNLQDAILAEKNTARGDIVELNNAWNCAVRIAKKEIVSSHRNNYVDCTLHRIEQVDIGDIVEHDNRIVQTTGQCVGVEYTIADGVRDTSIRVAFSYMDTGVEAPTEDLSLPTFDYFDPDSETYTTAVTYKKGEGFDTKLPDIDEQKVDELERDTDVTLDVAIENNPITLINGY